MKTAKEWIKELVFGEAATTLVLKLEETVEMIQHDAQDSLRAQLAVAEAKCKEACGECVPSGGYDYFDEVCGLLRVTRGQRDTAQAENRKLEQEAIRRIAHLNRLGTWAAQDPTGPLPVWMGSTVQSWVLEELKAALGSAYNPTSWQPEVVRDDLNKRIAQLETENTRLANERQILVAQCKELHASTFDIEKLKSENARLAAETTRLLDALIAADYILGRVQTITLKGDDNPTKYHWGEAADLVHSTLFQYHEYAASQPQKPDRTEGIDSLKAENARLAAELALSLNANRPLALSREELGKKVREVWIRWAQSQPSPKTHWLLPWSALAESDREVDRMIGEEIARWSLVADASLRAAREGGK